MASACLNNVGRPTENFLDCSVSYGWLNPRISLSREIHDGEKTPKAAAGGAIAKETSVHSETDAPDLECSLQDIGEFEFRLEDPVTMLPADELFSDGKLIPLQLSFSRLSLPSNDSSEVRSRKTLESPRRTGVATADPFLFSPKAPRCSSRWKDLLGLKKFYQNSNAKTDKSAGPSPSPSPSQSTGNNGNGSKSRRIFLHRSSKSSVVAAIESSMNLPLLKDLDSESAGCMSSRLSLSSSSSGHEHDDIPRLSLDSEKPILSRNTANPGSSSSSNTPPPKVRVMRQRASSSENAGSSRVVRSPTPRTPESSSASGVSVDSPRMNSSGKVVFQSLERSSSSPSTFNGGPRVKLRGMERSYSANLRVTPVLNVPVCSLSKSSVFGFPLFSSPQKREVVVGSPSIGGGVNNRSRGQQQHMISNRT